MSLSYSTRSIIGGPFDELVSKQLELRKNVLNKQTTRSPEDIKYLTSNTGWVRIISSVNTLDSDNVYTSDDAKNFILTGGTLNSFGGFNPNSPNSSYTRSDTYGFVPTAGVTSFQVSSKGTFGTLKAASFNFTVNSPEDFSKLEQLYLRPGFSILLEWGHSLYLSNADGVLNPMSNLYPLDKFLNSSTDKEIEKTISSLKGENKDNPSNSFNYDAMFGIIKNFLWSYNGESYECQVDIVSKGEVVESIKTGMSQLVKVSEDPESNNSKYTPYGSELQAYLEFIATAPSEGSGALDTMDLILFRLLSQSNTLTNRVQQKFQDLNKKFEILVGSKHLYTSSDYGKEKYITLRTLLILVNEINMLYNGNNPIVSFNVGEDGIKNTFITFPEHVGLNLGICVLPKVNNPIIKNAQASENQINDILEIYISVSFILELLSSKVERGMTDSTVVDFINRDILGSIQSNLGEINYFDLQEDIKNGITYLHVVDRKVIPGKNNIKTKLDLVGLNSEVYNLNIVSKLTNNLTSMIAISAQTNYSPSSAQDLYNIQKWNTGLRDRHLNDLKVGNSSKTTTEIDPEEITNKELKDNLDEYIKKISEIVTTEPSNIIPNPEGLEAIHKQVMGEYVRAYTNTGVSGSGRTNPPGLIPFELSFTLKGISGIKVGQAFTINDFFLPQRYKGHVAFIVVGVDHSVSNSQWTTTIRSQMIYV